jgi:hypothetical protein
MEAAYMQTLNPEINGDEFDQFFTELARKIQNGFDKFGIAAEFSYDSTGAFTLSVPAKPRDPGIEKIRERPGRLTGIAHALGITRQAVAAWKRVPATRVLAVSFITGISPQELRPDLYPASYLMA